MKNFYSVPIGIKFLSCALTEIERDILTRAIYLTNSKEGECTLSNAELSELHQCNEAKVTEAFSKASILGLQQSREDRTTHIIDETTGRTKFVLQIRHIKIKLPQIWDRLGEIWKGFYLNENPEYLPILEWAQKEVKDFVAGKAVQENKTLGCYFIKELWGKFGETLESKGYAQDDFTFRMTK